MIYLSKGIVQKGSTEQLPYPAANLPDEAFLSQARLNQQIY